MLLILKSLGGSCTRLYGNAGIGLSFRTRSGARDKNPLAWAHYGNLDFVAKDLILKDLWCIGAGLAGGI